MNTGPEADLVARCQRGEPHAWDQLFDLHYAPTSRYIFQLSAELSRDDAEEICQETFLSVIKNIGSFHGASQLRTWIFRIAANKTRDFREKQIAAKRGGGAVPVSLQAEDPETGLTLDPPAPLPSPDALLMSQEGMQLVSRGLDQLGDPCREVIELRYFADLSYEDISKALDVNQKTVSSRLSKCLDRLETVLRQIFGSQKTPFTV